LRASRDPDVNRPGPLAAVLGGVAFMSLISGMLIFLLTRIVPMC